MSGQAGDAVTIDTHQLDGVGREQLVEGVWLTDFDCVAAHDREGVQVRVQLVEGVLRCTGLRVEVDRELTRQFVRDLPLGAITESAVELVATVTGEPPPRVAAPRRRGRKGLPPEFYDDVARVYRYAATQRPRAPVQWMADHPEHLPGWDASDPPSKTTVQRWVTTARRKGRLGSAVPGKSGERKDAS